MKIELKPCPFCGGEAKVDMGFDGLWYVRCPNNQCSCSPITSGYTWSTEAIYRWNLRDGENHEHDT